MTALSKDSRHTELRGTGLLWLASAVVLAITRVGTWSDHLWAWDSINFALAISEIDVPQHQPHPPGYFGYVLLARMLRFGTSENVALLRVGLLASTLTAVLTWRLAARVSGSHRVAWAAWAVTVFSPLHWFYGSVAEIYTVETAATVAVAYAAYAMRQGDAVASILLAIAALGAVLVKLPALLLMLPLIAFALAGAPRSFQRRSVVMLTSAVVGGVCVLGLIEPLQTTLAFSTGQVGDVAQSSFLASWNPRALNRSVRDMAYATLGAAGAGGLGLLVLGRPRLAGAGPFLAVWACGYIVSGAVVHFPKPGYLLPLLPVIAIMVAAPAVRVSKLGVGLAVAAVATMGILQFAVVPPFSLEATGEGRRYADKTLGQQLRTELNSVLRPSWYAIKRVDRALVHFRAVLAAECADARPLVLIHAGGLVTWRHAMFYAPRATTVQIPDAAVPLLVATARRIMPTAGRASLQGDCVVVLERTADAALPGSQALAWRVTELGGQSVSASLTSVKLEVARDALRLDVIQPPLGNHQ